jgi:hypothetical protein
LIFSSGKRLGTLMGIKKTCRGQAAAEQFAFYVLPSILPATAERRGQHHQRGNKPTSASDNAFEAAKRLAF